ncbi:MAG TPA: 3-phosphoshikimate 1-carboxyvinyltransferase [Candidatus Limnocylindria bacterium]|nr:3-phosphoshikimate 1-carboxyvinyltransferase [Candidatus Limnocylindria bacterium]
MTVVDAASRTLRPASSLRGRLSVPADKSIAHRALIVNALSGGPATVVMRSPGRDVLSTAACLRALGVRVDSETAGPVVRFTLTGPPRADAELDCGNSGTTMRLLAGALAGLPLHAVLDGDASLRTRPMERVATLLRATGAAVATTNGRAPITVVGSERPKAVAHRIPVASAQLLGACALAALGAEGETTIEVPAEVRDHTERMLAATGVDIRRDGLVTSVRGPAHPRPMSLRVPGDPSSAAPWLVAGTLHPDADVTIVDVSLNPTRIALLDLMRRMGADVEATITDEHGPEPVGDLRVRGGAALTAVEIGGDEVAALIDELPLVAILMAAADGTSELRDASELRVKESDRIGATVAGLEAIGASVEELPDGWRVSRGLPRAGRVTTHGDHRIAIAFAVAALAGVASAVELDDPDCVAVSYPTFWGDVAEVSA